MEQFFSIDGDIVLRLVVALALGMVIGAERYLVHKEAGVKTHALISLGSAIFVIIGLAGPEPARVASQSIVGIGFLGAGSIIFQGSRLTGLTTAVGFWVTAGIGMAAGFKFYSLAVLATILTLFVLVAGNFIEKPIRKISEEADQNKV